MNGDKKALIDRVRGSLPEYAVFRLLAAWLAACVILKAVIIFPFTGFDYFREVSFASMAAFTAALWLFFCTVEKIGRLVLIFLGSGLLYCLMVIRQENSVYFAFGCCIIFALLAAVSPVHRAGLRLSRRSTWILTAALSVIFVLWVGGLCCLYYQNFDTPSFDFGIFSQMYYYMKKTGLPLTTVERHGLLSHMAVHMSPVFYLMLPLYWIFPFPETLQIGQCLVIALGLIPLYRICRRHQVGNKAYILFALILLTYIPFIGGCFFYLHENNFLVPLVLWMLDAFEEQDGVMMLITTALVLIVKEDAAIYAAAVCGCFLLKALREERQHTRRWKISESTVLRILEKEELWLLAFCMLYFGFAVYFLARYGNGAMTGRYNNYIYDGSGSLMVMLKGIFQNPIYVVTQCFTMDKWHDIFLAFIPIGFLPLIGLEPDQMILLAAYVLMNLMSAYDPQHAMGYQYYFGTGSLLIYMAVVNYSKFRRSEAMKKLLIAACGSSMILTFSRYDTKLLDYPKTFAMEKEDRERVEEAFAKVPKDASVLCSTYFQPSLSDRDEIYDIGYTSQSCEYIVLDLRKGDGLPRIDNGNEWNEKYSKDSDYELIDYAQGLVAVYRYIGGSSSEGKSGD